jgi:hypothetical protein
MYYLRLILLFVLLQNSGFVHSQELAKHHWENRLVLILAEDTNSVKYHDQIKEFQNHLKGMEERKILFYHITPVQYKSGLTDGIWQKSETKYESYKKSNVEPEIILIGLDGGVKLRASEFITSQKLFATIDVMPMRREEINRKNKQR